MAGRSPDHGAPAAVGAGTVLAGRYRLDRPLAIGGMARVWEAHDEVLGRPVAVKVLLDHLRDDESFVARFRAEALAAARLAHPSVVSVYDTCSEEGVEAIVMELIDGTTLRHHLDADSPLDPRAAARIGGQIAEALAVAHRAGIVHRDVKPANVLLAGNGRVVVTDFGIAKASEAVDLTTDQQMLGTAKYLAPEQVDGRRVDGRADVYALGVVLFEMVTGDVPFRADTEAATALARLHRPVPPVRSRRPEVPADLAEVVDRTLVRDPDQRWPDAASLGRALGAVAAGRDPALPPRPAPPAPAPPAPPADVPPATTGADRHPDGPGAGSAAAFRPEPPPPPPPPPPETTPPERGRGANGRPATARRRRVPVAVVALAALAVVVAGLLAWRVGGGATESVPVTATAFDPFGTDGENDDQAARAVDDDPDTTWQTERYDDPDVAGYKGGVGLLLDTGASRDVARLRVDSPSTGWEADVYVLDAPPEGPVDGWGEPVAQGRELDGAWSTDLDGAHGRLVLLWVTRTGEDGRVTVSDVTVEAST